MVFNSLQFLLFYIIITISFFYITPRFRWVLLLIASCYFYMAFVPIYIVILGFTIVIDYFAGLLLEKTKDGRKRKLLLILSLAANIGILGIFKYYNFFAENINLLLDHTGTQINYLYFLLPIGLSFHTFQAMSYTIEVYRGNQPAERHFGIYALYVMFYPQLVAGPIERPQNLLPQFHAKQRFNFERLKAGLLQMAFGMFKKVVIADRIALLVDDVYAHQGAHSGSSLLIATILYSFQIYADFSGYSDIGIGAAKTMGIDLMANFRSPYLSRSVNEFWSRWHISLSTWFRDYLYIPLGGNRVSAPRWLLNLFIVFLVSGIWHGANWTFIVWGALHGTFLIVEICKNMLLKRFGYNFKPNLAKSIFQGLITFSLVSFAWIFFRSTDISHAFAFIQRLFTGDFFGGKSLAINNTELIFCFLLIGILLLKEHFLPAISTKNTAKFVTIFTLTVIFCYLFGTFNGNQFIYFQF